MNTSQLLALVIFVIYTVFLQVLSVQIDSNEKRNIVETRAGKFLNLFSVIRFSNTPCSTKNGLNGTCYTEKQCAGMNSFHFFYAAL